MQKFRRRSWRPRPGSVVNLAAFTLEVMGFLFRIAAGVVLLGWNNKIDDVM